MQTNVTAEPAPGASARPWPLERVLFLLAGTITLAGVLLGALVSPWFLLIAGFVAVNQLAFVATGHCGASIVLERVFGVKRSAER